MRGRFAPSPTGHLHVGNLRTALLAWRHARDTGSEFLVRIEDLDTGRVREPSVESQLEDLRAIGVDWDGDPARQSDRLPLYQAAAAQLTAAGRTFPCFCSRREVRKAASAAHGPVDRYPGTCKKLDPEAAQARIAAGEQFSTRLRGGDHITVTDTRHGDISADVDDLVLVRADGVFAYNLAVVVDDAAQGVEQVVRGDDLVDSTPGQALLCDLLGLPQPVWTHVPLIQGPDGERLSKRHGAVTLGDLTAEGVELADVRRCLERSVEDLLPA